ncbi:MAG: glutamine amidotransferase [Planctomycetales bacterium]
MSANILYLGDTSLTDAASYLAGVITHWGWEFDYVPSEETADPSLFAGPRDLFVLSDYPASNLSDALQRELVKQVEGGAGLIMLGGWESFHGLGGDWDGTPVAAALPVEIASEDDRVNCDRPVLVDQVAGHPAVAGLPWKTCPPVIGGFNRITPKPDATVVLESQMFNAARTDEGFSLEPAQRNPLLIVGRHGKGRTAALATDVAPHWVGPWVDWGVPRVVAQATGANAVEVGGDYARFFRQLLAWTGDLD